MNAPTPGRIPPHNIEAEQAVLGTVLQNSAAVHDVADLLAPADFYRRGHQLLWQAVLDLAEHNQPVDLLTITSKLKQAGTLDECGGPTYVATLTDLVPNLAAIEHYSAMVRDTARLRRILLDAQQVASLCHQSETPELALEQAEAALLAMLDQGAKGYQPITLTVDEVFDHTEKMATSGRELLGLESGFYNFDAMTSGLCAPDLIILAGRPSMGKTSLAMNMVRHVALENSTGVGIFSLEMSRQQLVQRLYADIGRINLRALRLGKLTDGDWTKLLHAKEQLAKAPIFIDDDAGLSSMAIRTRARRMKARHNIGLIVIDYLQLMSGKGERREQEISEITRSLKAMAKELEVPVIALAQLNRELESRTNKRPRLSDLRESGAIEQDADVVAFIYRDEVYNTNPDNPHKGIAEIIIGKQRNGPTGTVELAWLEQYSSFKNLATRAV